MSDSSPITRLIQAAECALASSRCDATSERSARLSTIEPQWLKTLDHIPTPLALCTLGPDPEVVYLNEQFVRTYGYRLADIPKVSDWAIRAYPDESYRRVAMTRWGEAVARAIARQGVVESQELRVTRKDGQPRDVLISAAVVDDLLLGVFVDLTERKQAESTLRESEERFRLAFESANTGMCLVDLQGRLLQVNDRMCAIFGYSQQELEGMSVNDLAYPDDLALSPEFIDHAVHGNGDSATFEKRYRHRQGHVIHGQVASSLVRDAQGRPLYFISQVQDITERKQHEQALRQARADAEAANRAKSEFLANMSHEIRTPLNVVLGLAQVLARAPLSPDQHEMVERIQTAGESLLVILNDILDLSKIEAGQLILDPHPFDLAVLLDRLDGLLRQAAEDKGLGFDIAAPNRPLGPLLGDVSRLEQVLINLLGNAIKFTEQGEIGLAVEVLHQDATAVRLRFTVRDTGIGIAPEALGHLFTPFTQADVGITRRFGGTGLGLSISQRLVALMGGEIGVTSQLGQGSRFWCELPFACTVEMAIAPSTARPEGAGALAGPRLSGAHLLVVDDSALNLDLVERALALEGATATLAADGQQAVQILHARPRDFAAVLMDVRMPVMDGLTATRLIRDELGLTELPIIALTAGVLPDQQKAAHAAGVNAVLPKPLELERLTAALLTWIKPQTTRIGWTPGQPALPTRTAASDKPTEAFPTIAGIDPTQATHILGHDRALFIRLLERFIAEFADVARQTGRDLAQGEHESAARRMHTLRGNAGTLGMMALMALAGQLETAIERGETDLEERLATLGRQIDALVTASAPVLAAATATATAPGSTAALDRSALAALRADLDSHTLTARQRFDDLQAALRGVLGEARTAALGQAIRSLRYKEALAILSDIP